MLSDVISEMFNFPKGTLQRYVLIRPLHFYNTAE